MNIKSVARIHPLLLGLSLVCATTAVTHAQKFPIEIPAHVDFEGVESFPGSEMYPFNPSDAYRHAEGWVNCGASWCISLAYLKLDAAAKTTPSPRK